MTDAYRQFEINISALNNLTVVYDAFVLKVSPLDISDILRSQVVLAVSALDCYIHNLCEDAMLFIFQHKDFSTNNAFRNFSISLETLHQISKAATDSERLFFLSKEIKKNNGYKSFQEPDKVSSALSHIGIKSLWTKLADELGSTSTNLQMQLSLIIQRRNQIAHEADVNPALGIGEKYNIDSPMVQSTIDFIKKIVTSIEKVVDSEAIMTI